MKKKKVQLKSSPTQEAKAPNEYNAEVKVEPSHSTEETVAVTDSVVVAADLQELDEKINNMMEFTGNTIYSG